MSIEEDNIRLKAFNIEISTLNDKYFINKPIDEYFDLVYSAKNTQRRFHFYFKDGIDLQSVVKDDCISIFLKYFPYPEGVHGLVGI